MAYESVLVPGDIGLLVGIGVGVAAGLASLAAEETVQVGADLVGATVLDSVALSAAGLCLLAPLVNGRMVESRQTHLEELGTLGGVTWIEERVSDLSGRSGCLGLFSGLFGCFFGLARRLEFGLAHVDDLQEAEDVERSHDGAQVQSLDGV